jgi:hypothetical protein
MSSESALEHDIRLARQMGAIAITSEAKLRTPPHATVFQKNHKEEFIGQCSRELLPHYWQSFWPAWC